MKFTGWAVTFKRENVGNANVYDIVTTMPIMNIHT